MTLRRIGRSRLILSVFQTTGKPLEVAHLVALSGMEAARIKAALLQLDGANMITMRSVPSGASYETTFSINHLALTFLNQHHVVPAAKRAEIEKRRRRFTAMVEEVRGVIKSAPFSRRTIRARTETEIMVAGILLSALDAVKTPSRADFAAAEGYLEQAKSIAPDFFEVYRVEAFLRYMSKRVGEAVTAYEAAVELEPKHAPLRFWFAQMLMREDNLPDARTQLDHALRLAPDELVIKLEEARLFLYQREFERSRLTINAIFATGGLNDTYIRMAWDLRIQTYLREAEHELLKNRSPASALPRFEEARSAYEATPGEVRDIQIKQKIVKAHRTIAHCERSLQEGDLATRAYTLREWCEKIRLELAQTEALVIERKGTEIFGETFDGVVSQVTDKGFGFIKVVDGRIPREVFFHHSEVQRGRWQSVLVGIRVSFVMDRDVQGRLRALRVTLL